ncbi:hypothetical protein E4T80_08620 [Muribacter muris]|uniref:Uncharacterized protein n=1 Tax=Muribacter muris TaxID=67855 RepID=A0A4Y9JTT8_9PAST|nr:hypothetical protein [Muribacter muris]MBF0785521.1 hypothetical protein [Muribacter muris]MBF0827164.1 hypothetical protein [Muribacter muris]TFV09141.1 hypothetical protein E4T80_08620 [Muribacter muris]
MKRNINEVISKFTVEKQDIQHRYYSFDFCYSHFRSSKESGHIDIEKSCQVLWGYLASWGMLRGSSFLLQKNPTYLKDLINWIYSKPLSTWEIDVEYYSDKAEDILMLYHQAKEHLLKGNNHEAVTLVTKVLLGVFAIIPAYDRFFKKAFSEIAGNHCRFSVPNKKSLGIIYEFYLENREEIEKLSKAFNVLDFNGQPTKYYYSKAKIIDMYGFQLGLNYQ